MAKDIILAAGFVASGVGATGLTVTVDVWRVATADLAKSEIVTAGSATEIGDGLYAYRVASADLQTYYYYGVFKTTGTADVKNLFSVQLDFADTPSIVSLVWAAGTRTLTSFGTLVADVWSYATRLLTAGTNIVLTKGTGVTGFNDLSQPDVRAAVGLASANLDTQISAIPTVGDINTELSAQHGAGVWGASGGSGDYTVTLTIRNADTLDTLREALVTVKDVGDTTIVDQKRADLGGETVFSLDAATYSLHVSLPGFESLVQNLVVSANTSQNIDVTPIAVGTPSAPDLCRVYGYEYLNGTAVEGRVVLANLQDTPQSSGTVLLEQVTAQTETDSDGYWYLDLVIGKNYKIKLAGAGVQQVITVPDTVSVNIVDLI